MTGSATLTICASSATTANPSIAAASAKPGGAARNNSRGRRGTAEPEHGGCSHQEKNSLSWEGACRSPAPVMPCERALKAATPRDHTCSPSREILP